MTDIDLSVDDPRRYSEPVRDLRVGKVIPALEDVNGPPAIRQSGQRRVHTTIALGKLGPRIGTLRLITRLLRQNAVCEMRI